MSSNEAPKDLVIQKEKVHVELCTSRGRLARGDVFLRPPHEASDRGERLLDVLAERWFLPVHTVEKMTFCSTRDLAWVRIDLMAALDELDPEAENDEASCTARVTLELLDGSKLEGTVLYSMPAGYRRLGDYLEKLPHFFPLRTDDWLYLVSAACVASVTPLEEKR